MKNLKLRRVIRIINDNAEDSVDEIAQLFRDHDLSSHQRTMLDSLMVVVASLNEMAESFMHTLSSEGDGND